MSGGRSGGDGVALGANRQAVAAVLNVASGDDGAVLAEQRGTHLEPAVGGMGVAACGEGSMEQPSP